MEKTDNKTKGTKLPLGTALIAAVAIVTIVILIVCQGILFPQEYSAPDYNHFLSNALAWLIAIVGIGSMLFICYRKNDRAAVNLILFFCGAAVILYIVITTMSDKTYYYYDTNYRWARKNIFGLKCTYPHGYMYGETFIFGNALLLQYDTTKISHRNNEVTIYQNPAMYNKELQKITKPFVLTYVDDMPRLVAYFCEDTTKNEYGVLDADLNVIVKPGQYQDVSEFKFRHHIPVMQNGKWGLVNLKGDLVVGCMFDKLQGFMSNDYFDGGYLMGYQGNDDFVMVDTLGNVITYEEYNNKYPNMIIIE